MAALSCCGQAKLHNVEVRFTLQLLCSNSRNQTQRSHTDAESTVFGALQKEAESFLVDDCVSISLGGPLGNLFH